jgi:glutamate dehydrogenase (NAD(P)+)
MIVTREALKHLGRDLKGATVAVQGFGNVGSVSADLIGREGAKIVAVTDWKGGVHNPRGFDVPALIEYAQTHHERTVAGFPGGDPITAQQFFALDVDVLVPAAMENQITIANVRDIRARVIVEGANGPTTPEANKILSERNILVIPDILANGGGVTVSYFEWVQDRHGYFWSEKEVNERLETKMCEAFNETLRTALEYHVDMRTAAYMVAINRVATVTRMRGMYA